MSKEEYQSLIDVADCIIDELDDRDEASADADFERLKTIMRNARRISKPVVERFNVMMRNVSILGEKDARIRSVEDFKFAIIRVAKI